MFLVFTFMPPREARERAFPPSCIWRFRGVFAGTGRFPARTRDFRQMFLESSTEFLP